MKPISRFQYITHTVEGYSHAELAEQACKGGADWVQLRVKNISQDELLKIAFQTKDVCREYNACFIINDHLQIVKRVGADGVHLGRKDFPASEARKMLGKDYIIGGSANSFSDVVENAKAGLDYTGIGPFRFTFTKEKLNPVLGFTGIEKIVEECRKNKISIPLIAIGGIGEADIPHLMECGIHGIAVSSGVNLASDKRKKTEEILRELFKVNLKKKK